MRIRRTILAPAILAIGIMGTIGVLAATPALAATAAPVAATANAIVSHSGNSPAPDVILYHT